MATREEIEEIRTRVGILEVVSRYVDVRPRGERYVALCPFHPDSSPSLTISPEKGLFHCFGCGEGGDVFKFLMAIEKIEFPEAVRRLAEEAGVKLSGERAFDDKGRLRGLLEQVARHYQRRLKGPGGRQAREYLKGRGVTDRTIERFRLGYAPPGGEDLLRAFSGRETELMRLGLVMEGGGRRFSFFRRRVIFPLMSTQGDVVGFAGRTLGGEEPKYLNTKNTSLFEKGRLLYGFPWAREAMSGRGEALIVEGYTDVIMAHQFGFTHAVASMGTAFTAEQALLIKRFARRALIAYDRDVAGRAATLRGIRQLLSAGLEVWVVLLPPGEDPDGLLRREGKEAFAELLEGAMPFHEFYVQALIEEHGSVSLGGQERILEEARSFLRGLESPALRAQILRELSGSLDIPIEDLIAGMKAPKPTAIMGDRVQGPSWGVEEHLMYLLMEGELPIRRAVEELTPADFHRFSHAVEVLFALYREEGGPERLKGLQGRRFIEEWFSRLDAEEQRELRALALSERRDEDSERAASQLIGQLRLAGVERRLKGLKREIERSERRNDRKSLERLQQEQQGLLRERQRLLRQLGWGAITAQGGGRRDG